MDSPDHRAHSDASRQSPMESHKSWTDSDSREFRQSPHSWSPAPLHSPHWGSQSTSSLFQTLLRSSAASASAWVVQDQNHGHILNEFHDAFLIVQVKSLFQSLLIFQSEVNAVSFERFPYEANRMIRVRHPLMISEGIIMINEIKDRYQLLYRQEHPLSLKAQVCLFFLSFSFLMKFHFWLLERLNISFTLQTGLT